ncbi:UTRA domain-containing protein [Streptomyces sp. NPDC059142]|uniref:UTRA domain-containing protein n=1 Tax=Streptomyces sp. NPDC059142 TaxID=3346739 RepID=UPI0036A4AC89
MVHAGCPPHSATHPSRAAGGLRSTGRHLAAHPAEAEELELPPGTSVLLLRETSYDLDDRVVEMERW